MRWTALALTAMALGIAGCAPRGVPTTIDPARSLEVDSAVDLAGAYPFDLPPTRFTLVNHEGARIPVVREFRPRAEGRTELVERDETTGEVRSRVVLSRAAGGDVVIHETATPARDLLTRFDPPMLFLPAALAPGETFEQSLRVETFTLDDPPRPKGAGDGTLTITRAPDRAEASNPSRSWAVLESTLTARIGPATVRTHSVYALEPASDARPGSCGGLRGRDATRTVRVLGFVVERESETLDSPESAETADTP